MKLFWFIVLALALLVSVIIVFSKNSSSTSQERIALKLPLVEVSRETKPAGSQGGIRNNKISHTGGNGIVAPSSVPVEGNEIDHTIGDAIVTT